MRISCSKRPTSWIIFLSVSFFFPTVASTILTFKWIMQFKFNPKIKRYYLECLVLKALCKKKSSNKLSKNWLIIILVYMELNTIWAANITPLLDFCVMLSPHFHENFHLEEVFNTRTCWTSSHSGEVNTECSYFFFFNDSCWHSHSVDGVSSHPDGRSLFEVKFSRSLLNWQQIIPS